MAGCKFFDSPPPSRGAIWSTDAPLTDPAAIFANNDEIFMILRSLMFLLKTPISFMILQKRPEVLLQLYGENYNFLGVRKVKIQSQYHVSTNHVMQHHIFGGFKHEKTFGAVVLVIRHSCYEIQTYCYTFQSVNTHYA